MDFFEKKSHTGDRFFLTNTQICSVYEFWISEIYTDGFCFYFFHFFPGKIHTGGFFKNIFKTIAGILT